MKQPKLSACRSQWRANLLTLALCLVALPLSAQYANVKAKLTDASGNVLKSGFMRFELENCGENFPLLSGTNTTVVQTTVDLKPNQPDGTIVSRIIGNDAILCGNIASTYWQVTLMKDAQTPLSPLPGMHYYVCSSPLCYPYGGYFDPSTAQPLNDPAPQPGWVYVFGNPIRSQNWTQPTNTQANFAGLFDFQQGVNLGAAPIASLNSFAPNKGAVVTVRDGLNNTDCSTGGGTSVNLCLFDGSSWSVVSGSGGGGGPTLPVSVTNGGTGTSVPGTVSGSLCYFSPGSIFCDPNAITDTTGHLSLLTINANAFTIGGSGAGLITFTTGTGIGAPASGKANVWVDSGTGLMSCLLNGSVNCMPAGGGGGGTPGGSNTQLQFDDVGAFAGATGLTWNKSTNVFTVPGGTAINSPSSNFTAVKFPALGQWLLTDGSGGSAPLIQVDGTGSTPDVFVTALNSANTMGATLKLFAYSQTVMGHAFTNGVAFLSNFGGTHGFAVNGSTGGQWADELTILGNSGSFFDASAVATLNGFKIPVQAGLTTSLEGALGVDSTAHAAHLNLGGTDRVICTTAGETGCGSSGGGGSTGGVGVGFTAQTSVTIAGTTHKIGSKNLLLQCYDNASPANSIQPASYTVNGSTFDVVVNFTSSQTGYCVVSGLGPAKFSAAFTGVTTETVTGATHGLSRADLSVTIWDNASPRNRIEAASITVNSSTFDVVATFTTAQTGTIVIQ